MEAFKRTDGQSDTPEIIETSTQVRQRWLNAYSYIGTIHGTCIATDIDRSRAYYWMRTDPAFKAAMQEAGERSTDVIEEEARRRAYEGWDEPVFYKGEVAGKIRRYSDILLMFTLKARAPEKYRERVDNRHSIGDGAQPDNALSEAEALRIRAAYLGALPAGPQQSQGDQDSPLRTVDESNIIDGKGGPVGPS